MEFPIYRKKFDSQSYYKITSFSDFEEIQLIGKRFFLYKVHADKYFEILQVREMVESSSEMYRLSSKEEYEKKLEEAREYLKNREEL